MTQAVKPAGRLCAVCSKTVPHGWLMCRDHWRLVPVPLQSEVSGTYRRFRTCQSAVHARQRLNEYLRAAEAAATYVTGLLSQVDSITYPPTQQETP